MHVLIFVSRTVYTSAQLGEDESGSEMDMALQNQDPLHSTKTDEKEGEKEGEEVEFEVCSEQDPVMADSTTTCRSESPTSTQLKQGEIFV